ncbi:alpha/beta hydrolase [Flavobacterium sp.]|uniref:alpha/beta hydrolase n=1 Tax=Flavobacterium sp. TaxID=239 RepID=UPI0026135863|nr:alpha/beta hydrolase [Flavobacterium sp.]
MKKLFLLFAFFSLTSYAQDKNFSLVEVKINELLTGNLYSPENSKKPNLVIIIAGSGPTDRDGNQNAMKNNSLKFLAEAIAKNGNAAFSFDKRIFSQMKSGTLKESDLSFEDLINDTKDIIKYFKSQKKYNKIIIAGHSEGSLIGMIAANENADAYISLSGPGRSADLIIIDQLSKQAPALTQEVTADFEILKKGETFELKNQMLASIFRQSIQPYIISWIKYNPQEEIKKLKIPVLIVNGTKDLQVSVSEAELLKKAKPEATLKIIANMNHVLKEIKTDDAENMKSYNTPDLPVTNELITDVNDFIKKI